MRESKYEEVMVSSIKVENKGLKVLEAVVLTTNQCMYVSFKIQRWDSKYKD